MGPRDKTTDAGESTEWGKTVKHKKCCILFSDGGAGEVGPRAETTDAGESTEWGKTEEKKV